MRYLSNLRAATVAALRRVARRYWLAVMEIPFPSAWSFEAPAPPNLVVRPGRRGDAAALSPLLAGNDTPEARFARGDLVSVAELNGSLVACNWVAQAPFRLWFCGLEIRPHRGECYGYGLYVRPDVRGLGVGMAVRKGAVLEAERSGARVMFYHIDAQDSAYIAWHEHAGARLRETLFGLVLLDRFAVTLRRRRGPDPTSPPATHPSHVRASDKPRSSSDTPYKS